MIFKNPSDFEIKKFLLSIQNIAVLGLSPKHNRPSNQVASSLQQFGYRIIPVRPAIESVLGERAFPDLDSLIQKGHIGIDLLDVFRASEHVEAIVEQCIRLKLGALWLQDGVINHAAAQRAHDAGIFTVMDRCIYRDYINFVK